jgi:cytochrome c556
MSIESKLGLWFLNFINKDQPKKVKENVITDYLEARRTKIIALREKARQGATKRVQNGEPYDITKLKQADYLLSEITNRLNNRYTNFNSFNFN